MRKEERQKKAEEVMNMAEEGATEEVTEGEVDAMVVEMGCEYKKKEGLRRARRAVLNLNEKRREPTDDEVAAQVAGAPEYPQLVVSMKHFRLGFCKCIVRRKGSECDCQLCTYVNSNLTKFHRARTGWRNITLARTRAADAGLRQLLRPQLPSRRLSRQLVRPRSLRRPLPCQRRRRRTSRP